MSHLTVYTAALGETDAVQAPAIIHSGVRYLCFSDRPCPKPYEWIPTEPTDNPAMASRVLKVRAHHPLLQEAALTLWHDAAYRLTGALDWIPRMLAQSDLVGLRHHRHRLEDEAIAIADRGFIRARRAWKIACQYRAAGFASQSPITMGGLLARRNDSKVQQFNASWWTEVQRWQGRDQASLDYAAWVAGITIAHLSGWLRKNSYAEWRAVAA